MIEVVRDGSRAVVKPGADVVASLADELRASFRAALGEGATEITLDLAGVEMLDSVGLGLLIALHNSLTKKGGSLQVVNASSEVKQLFKVMRLDQHFKVTAAT